MPEKLRCVDPECGREPRCWPAVHNSFVACDCGWVGQDEMDEPAALAAWKRVQERSNPERDADLTIALGQMALCLDDPPKTYGETDSRLCQAFELGRRYERHLGNTAKVADPGSGEGE